MATFTNSATLRYGGVSVTSNTVTGTLPDSLILSDFPVPQAAMTWKVARNAVIDALRRYEDTEALPEGHDEVDEDRTLLKELHEEINRLEEPDQTIVKMQLEGYSYEEIGNALGMTEKNVSVRLVRAKERLKRKMVNS